MENHLADYLRSKGYGVVKPIEVSDWEIIDFLESKGYIVNGLLNDSYYETGIDGSSQFEEQMTLKEKNERK